MALIKSKKLFGKARANKFARVANNLKLSDNCECTDAEVCQDNITINVAGLTSIIVDGVTYHINTPVYDGSGELIWNPTQNLASYAPDTPAQADYFVSFIYAVLSMYEVDPYVSIDGEEETITHIGAYELTVTGATTERCCEFDAEENEFVCP